MALEPRAITAIVVAGPLRDRAQRVVDAFSRQTAIDRMEIVVVDLKPAGVDRLDDPGACPMHYLEMPTGTSWARARAAALHRVTTPLLAYVEDHCYPTPTWAEELIEAHRRPHVAIGYAFLNANPQTATSRAGLITDYGAWAHPARDGVATHLPGNNVSYKRTALTKLTDRLEPALAVDFLVHDLLTRDGGTMAIAARAHAAHENYESLADLLRANHAYCRVIGGARAHLRGWSTGRRLFYGLAAPLAAPAIKLLRLAFILRGRSTLWRQVVAALPPLVLTFLWSGVGESLGYLFGAGSATEDFKYWELERIRASSPPDPATWET